MPTDHSGDLRLDPATRPPRRRRSLTGGLVLAAGGAVALGLALGLWARPNFRATHDTDAAEHAAAPVPIEVDKPAPPPPVTAADGKLEVLPPDTAAAAQRPPAQGAWASIFSELAPPPPLPPAQGDPAPPQPRVAVLTPPPAAVVPAAPTPAASDCTAGGLADQMICSDDGLAQADREMSRAYRRALRAGVSPAALRADQRDWLGIREEAAHHSRRALAQVYAQRIEELNAAAGEDDSPDDGN